MSEEIKTSFFDDIDKYTQQMKERMPAHLQAMLEAGASITYYDEHGRYVRKMPDGEIIVLSEASNS